MHLDMADHGRYTGTKRASRAAHADRHITYEPFTTDEVMKHTLVIDGFRIDQFSEVVIHQTTRSPHLTHARFMLADYRTPVATWYEPVVARLFWLGFPVTTHSRFSEGGTHLYQQVMANAGKDFTHPLTVTTRPHRP